MDPGEINRLFVTACNHTTATIAVTVSIVFVDESVLFMPRTTSTDVSPGNVRSVSVITDNLGSSLTFSNEAASNTVIFANLAPAESRASVMNIRMTDDIAFGDLLKDLLDCSPIAANVIIKGTANPLKYPFEIQKRNIPVRWLEAILGPLCTVFGGFLAMVASRVIDRLLPSGNGRPK
jgi:hypothetical protein